MPKRRLLLSAAHVLEARIIMILVANNERVNDPSAGSPTETLLRLLLPLSVRVYKIFQL